MVDSTERDHGGSTYRKTELLCSCSPAVFSFLHKPQPAELRIRAIGCRVLLLNYSLLPEIRSPESAIHKADADDLQI